MDTWGHGVDVVVPFLFRRAIGFLPGSKGWVPLSDHRCGEQLVDLNRLESKAFAEDRSGVLALHWNWPVELIKILPHGAQSRPGQPSRMVLDRDGSKEPASFEVCVCNRSESRATGNAATP